MLSEIPIQEVAVYGEFYVSDGGVGPLKSAPHTTEVLCQGQHLAD